MDIELDIPQLNVEETLRKCKKFFNKDLERLVLMSGHSMTDLQSPQFDSFNSGSMGTYNSAESRIANGIDAENIVKSVHDAIKHIDPVSQKIIIGLYLKHQTWIDVQVAIYKEHTTFAKLRKRALLSFAMSFERWQVLNHCDRMVFLQVY